MFFFLFFLCSPVFALDGVSLCSNGQRFDALRVRYLEIPLAESARISISLQNQQLAEVVRRDGDLENLQNDQKELLSATSWFFQRQDKFYIKVKKMIKKAKKHTQTDHVLLFIDTNGSTKKGCSVSTNANDVWVNKMEFLALKKELDVIKGRLSLQKNKGRGEVERKAKEMLDAIHRLVAQGRIDGARSQLVVMQKQFGKTKMWKRGLALKNEISVIGKGAPVYVGIKDWIQSVDGEKISFSKGVIVLVFGESWCPYCVREIPKLEKIHQAHKSQGLRIIGVTKLSRGASKQKMQQFLRSNKVTFDFFQEDGELSQYFKVTGIPAAAVIKDGVIVWRGHPARLGLQKLETWLAK